MKRSFLLLFSLAAAFAPALRRNLSTANGAAEDILEKLGLSPDASPDEVEAMRIKLIDAANPAAMPAGDPLNLRGLALPAGIDRKDVLWRKAAGLSNEHAVQAATAQKRHDDAVGKEKAAKAKRPATPAAGLLSTAGAQLPDLAGMTLAQLIDYATKGKIELGSAKAKADIIATIEAFNKNLAKEERAAS